MWWLLLVPFVIQAFVINLDEFGYHVKRGLPRWERLGHPLDTLTVIFCFLYILLVPYDPLKYKVYVFLALFSTFFITKDEFIHKHHCPAGEQWLHAVLFVNHSIVLTALGLLWPVIHYSATPAWLAQGIGHPEFFRRFLWLQLLFAGGFMLYQIVFWNIVWRNKKIMKH